MSTDDYQWISGCCLTVAVLWMKHGWVTHDSWLETACRKRLLLLRFWRTLISWRLFRLVKITRSLYVTFEIDDSIRTVLHDFELDTQVRIWLWLQYHSSTDSHPNCAMEHLEVHQTDVLEWNAGVQKFTMVRSVHSGGENMTEALIDWIFQHFVLVVFV